MPQQVDKRIPVEAAHRRLLAAGQTHLRQPAHNPFQGYRRVNKYPLQQRLRAAKPLLQAVLNVSFRIAGSQNIRLRHAKPQLAMRIVEAA